MKTDNEKEERLKYRIVRYEDGLHVMHEVWYDAIGNPVGYLEKSAHFTPMEDNGYGSIVEALETALKDVKDRPPIDHKDLCEVAVTLKLPPNVNEWYISRHGDANSKLKMADLIYKYYRDELAKEM